MVKIGLKNLKRGPKRVKIVQRNVKFSEYRSEIVKTGQRSVKFGWKNVKICTIKV